MSSQQNNTSLEQLNAEDSQGFITTYTPKGPADIHTLMRILAANRDHFKEQIGRRGVLLFRGFAPQNADQFHGVVKDSLGLEPWNAFNTKSMPSFIGTWLRKYSENLLGGGDYRRYLDRHTVQLGPAESAVQGPHVEGGGRSERARYIALCCFETAPKFGETGMVDLHQVYRELPAALREKYTWAWNRFYFVTKRKVNLFDKLLLSKSPLQFQQRPDGRANLFQKPCPAVCAVPETGELCLQPWAFARNTNGAVQAAAVRAFPGRGEIKRDSTAEDMNLTWELCDDKGRPVPWSEAEQQALFDAIFQRAYLLPWHKGDIALIDNIRIGHWRMNGEQGNRKLVQIQASVMDAEQYRPVRGATPSSMGGAAPVAA